MSLDQVLGSLVLDHALRMGVDAGLVSLAQATPPWEMHYLTVDELWRFRVDNTGSTDTGWRIEARNGGAALTIASAYSTRPPITFSLVCHRGRVGANLIVSTSSSYLDRWLSEGYGMRQRLTGQEVRNSLNGIDILSRGWKLHLNADAVLRLNIDSGRRTTIIVDLSPDDLRIVRVGGPLKIVFDLPLEFASFLYSDISSDLLPEELDLVLRNCGH
jgi:hypothetical protein